ncbi:LysR family transcriptional regulator, partial [Paraburkholderia sp. GAS334]|uniref:LysR family transcriptional regulator n=1 Tax=Paraburkholderia sp. GAS334 TaxID=3035131 RepID=UPI003D242E74
MGFDRQQLETFAVVVELRHFGHAARSLNITRGAVSQRINALEESLGMPLLVRDGAAPTPAGEALLRHIQVIRAGGGGGGMVVRGGGGDFFGAPPPARWCVGGGGGGGGGAR